MARSFVTVLALTCYLLAAPAHADKKAASEHFALAEQAEKRKDWRAAIDEYELAYGAAPHPAMLYNIARNYERLAEARNAAEYYRRYLDEASDASDHAKVQGRIDQLRQRRSRVDIVATPAGAGVFIDGEHRGAAPQTLTLDAGEHEAYVAHQGRTSRPRRFTVEYGEAQSLRFDLEQRAGFLVIHSNVDGAEVHLDGELIGRTPFSGPVPAGKHQVVITRAGYAAHQREIVIAPSGSQQLRADLQRTAGTAPDPEPAQSARWLFGFGYGYDGLEEATRFTLDLGVRSAGETVELALLYGLLGPQQSGFGVAGRYYFARTGKLRPYLRAAALVLNDSSSSTNDYGRMLAVEGGLGALIPMQTRVYRIDYYLELDVQGVVAGLPDEMDGVDGPGRFAVPVSAGIIWSFGAGRAQR